MLDGIAPLIGNVNKVLTGEQVLAVKVDIPPKDMFIMGTTIFLAMFLAVVCANLVTRRF